MSGTAPHFDRATIGSIDEAIRDGNVLGLAPAETEDRPARRERAIGYRDKLATAEQRARVVLALHIAIADMDVLAADEMKPVVVVVDPVVNVDAFQLHIFALDNPDRVKRALRQKNVTHGEVLALMEQQVIRTVAAPDAGGRWRTAGRAAKLRALAVNCSRPLDDDILEADTEDQTDVQTDVPVLQRRVSVKRDGLGRMVLVPISAAQQLALRRKVQFDIALHLDRADDKHAGGHKNRPALVLVAGINRGLNGGCVQRANLEQDVREAYRLGANSYFTKPSALNDLMDMLRVTYEYWSRCECPPVPCC